MSEQNNQFPDNNPGYGQQSAQPEQQSYQQGFDQQNQQSQQNQAQGQPYIPAPQQGQWAPSAYSAPGYGYPPQPQQPHNPSGFAALFSTNFSTRVARSIAPIIMILAFIVAGCHVLVSLFAMISVFGEYTPTTVALAGVLSFLLSLVVAVLIIGGARLLCEAAIKDEQ
ncbi:MULTISPECIES: DUF4282 domain-containing protein [Actinotignum]|uniref:DUF4282 domain-containing protein n=1 Tax=Actinotignum TaxID=1653174 RepID=UPI000426EB8F|nr:MULTISPECIES: DUF4282 domain-containing protein [Actinotignum]AIE82362.1 hypothetical protein FB03_02710 [Actinotignum schaalii]MDE1536563.1 DUF4282 domain-containing protein [Actinotignum schaalii]MDK7270823.1 DUF4282 domain-containing protein [Actinotignum schaalii]MDY5130871.1 DUF4282 domain-containing protein [Actinotignum timonense]MDY5134045.1 DUF4282 domain-containing protein [Actinotignum timonense]